MDYNTKELFVAELANFAYDNPELMAASLAMAAYRVQAGESEESTVEDAKIAIELAKKGMLESESTNYIDFVLDGVMATLEESDLAAEDFCDCEECSDFDCEEDDEEDAETLEILEDDFILSYEDLLRGFMNNQGEIIRAAEENRKRNLETLRAMGFDVSGLE